MEAAAAAAPRSLRLRWQGLSAQISRRVNSQPDTDRDEDSTAQPTRDPAKPFTNFITCTIVFAGLLVGAQTYPDVDENDSLRTAGEVLDTVVLCIFTAEAALKMMSHDMRPWRYFAMSLRVWNGWNCFDFAIVVASWSMDSNAATLLRLLRLLRVLKLVKAVKSLQTILSGLYKGLSSIAYILVLLLLVFYLFGILAMIMFRENDPFHFGSLPITLLTLFRMATLEDWTDVSICLALTAGSLRTYACTSN